LIDVGTGDGRAAYELAKASPDVLVVGLDVTQQQLVETSRRAARRPERGGVPNLLFALARAQEPPPVLCGRADDIRVTLPWGDLLEGVALAHPDVLGGLAALARPGARLRIVVNGEPWSTNAPKRMRHLPQLTPRYVRSELVDRYADHGIAIKDARRLTRTEIDDLHSTWAKKLRSGRDVDLTLIDCWLPGR
jgi:16S rRNA (adenine(1408)-N(1))-methyltransferase